MIHHDLRQRAGTLLRRLRSRLRGEEGSSLVETGMVLAVFFPLLFGAIQFSLLFYASHDVTDAARQAVRWAAVRGSTSCTNTPGLTGCKATSDTIQSYVRGLNYPGLTAANISVTTNWLTASSTPVSWSTCSSAPCNAPGNQVQITVSYPYPLFIPYWKSLSITVSSTAAMVVAQ